MRQRIYSATRNVNIEGIGDSPIDPLTVDELLGSAEPEWTLRTLLSTGILLGNSSKGASILAEHQEELQNEVFSLGKHLALALQAYLDCQPFEKPFDEPFNLISAPLMYQLEHDRSLYSEIETAMTSTDEVDYEVLYDAVLSGPGLQKSKQLLDKHLQTSLELLEIFDPCEAKSALRNVIQAMQL